MAYLKVLPVVTNTHLNNLIKYITRVDKTDGRVFVSAAGCGRFPENKGGLSPISWSVPFRPERWIRSRRSRWPRSLRQECCQGISISFVPMLTGIMSIPISSLIP